MGNTSDNGAASVENFSSIGAASAPVDEFNSIGAAPAPVDNFNSVGAASAPVDSFNSIGAAPAPVDDFRFTNKVPVDNFKALNNGTSMPFEPYPLAEKIKPNVLSEYDNMTYNFRLFMTTERATIETIPQENIIILAETGSTGLYITDVSIDTIISPSLKTKNSFATSVTIKIIEPFGSSMLDFMRESALELGVFDHKRVPLWLDLRFKGYNPGGDTSYEGGDTVTLENQTRTWSLRTSKVDIEMNKGGTEYTLECIVQNEASLEDSARRLDSMIKIEAITVGEFFEKFTEVVNGFSKYDTYLDKDKIENLRNYKITLPDHPLVNVGDSKRNPVSFPSMSTWKLREDDRFNIKSQAYNDFDKDLKWVLTFKAGTSIDTIIQQVIGCTKEGQSLLLFGEIGRRLSGDTERDLLKPSIAFVIDPKVTITSYNKIARAYNIDIEYIIKDYKTFIPISSRNQIIKSKSTQNSEELLTAKLKISNLIKKYDYMFTGENTEVLDYKVELNSAWFVSLPLFKGQGRSANPSPSLNGNVNTKNSQVTETATTTLLQSRDDLKKKLATLQDIQKSDKSIFLGDGDIQTSDELIKTTAERLAEVDRKIKLEVEVALSDSQTTLNSSQWGAEEKLRRISIDNDNTTTSNISSISNTSARRIENKNNTGSIFFAEDIIDPDLNVEIKTNSEVNDIGAQISPTSATGETNIEGTDDPDRAFFSSAMNQIYGFKGQMTNLSLEIRGDPYWLGEPNINKRLTQSQGYIDLTGSDSLLLLSFKFPVSIDDGGNERRDESYSGSGLYNLRRKENGFNGLYRVTTVENNFSGGKFTQHLVGHIDPLTKEQDIIKLLNKLD